MGSVLLVLGSWRFSLSHMHFHRAGKEQLLRRLTRVILTLEDRVTRSVVTLSGRSLSTLAALGAWLLALISVVKLINVQAVSSVVLLIDHRCGGCSLDRLSSVALLSVQGTSFTLDSAVDRVQDQFICVFIRDKCVALGVVSEVSLIHELFVERRVDWSVATSRARR